MSPPNQHTHSVPCSQPTDPTEERWGDALTASPYLGQAGVLVDVLAFLHAGRQLLQDAPAAGQCSGQPSKLPPAWSTWKREKTRSRTSRKHVDTHTTSYGSRSRYPHCPSALGLPHRRDSLLRKARRHPQTRVAIYLALHFRFAQ